MQPPEIARFFAESIGAGLARRATADPETDFPRGGLKLERTRLLELLNGRRRGRGPKRGELTGVHSPDRLAPSGGL